MQISHSFWNVCEQYFAESIVLPVFLLALLYLLKKWKKEKRIAFYAIAAASLLVLYNGVSHRILEIAGEGSTYYRFFWICPILLVITYGIVELVAYIPKKHRLSVLLVLSLAGYMFSQTQIQSWVTLPENIYQLDDDVIQTADALMELTGGEPTTLIDNGTLTGTIRQYNAKIHMTDLYTNLINEVLYTDKIHYLGRYIQEYMSLNESEYIAIEKERIGTYKLIESGGMKKAAETDNYRLYYADPERIEKNLSILVKLTKGIPYHPNIEYIPVSGLQKEYSYVYLSDFGGLEQEEAYQTILTTISDLEIEGVFINTALSKNREWTEKYQYLLEELNVPYYCNDTAFQIIENEDVIFCMMENTKKITAKEIEAFDELKKAGKPVILILSQELKESEALYQSVTGTDSPVIQILTTKKNEKEKKLIEDSFLQFATPVESGQLFNIIRISGLEKQ